MSKIFKKIEGGGDVDLLQYTKDTVSVYPNCKIYVGCDSQNNGGHTTYVTTVVFRFERRGAHVIYQKDVVPRIKELWTKLWGELQRSMDVADYLTGDGEIEVYQIDLDYNKNPRHKSNSVLKAAVGYVESYGYNYACKPDLLISISIANELCR